ncbi:hypothetical protein FAIPA1_140013 [Frankia sp. AiPs1]
MLAACGNGLESRVRDTAATSSAAPRLPTSAGNWTGGGRRAAAPSTPARPRRSQAPRSSPAGTAT